MPDEFDLRRGNHGLLRWHALGIIFGGDGPEDQALAGTARDHGLVTAAAFEHGIEVRQIQVGLLLVFAMTFEAMLAEDGFDVLVVSDDGISGSR